MITEYVKIIDGFYVVKIYVKIRDGLYAVTKYMLRFRLKCAAPLVSLGSLTCTGSHCELTLLVPGRIPRLSIAINPSLPGIGGFGLTDHSRGGSSL